MTRAWSLATCALLAVLAAGRRPSVGYGTLIAQEKDSVRHKRKRKQEPAKSTSFIDVLPPAEEADVLRQRLAEVLRTMLPQRCNSTCDVCAIDGVICKQGVPVELLVDCTAMGLQPTGPIPASLGDVVSLAVLYLDGCTLPGPLPRELGALRSLRELYLPNSGLTGPLPAEMGNLTELVDLVLSNNSLNGSLPKELKNLQKMQAIELRKNDLSGEISGAMLQNMPGLFVLDLGYNHFTGIIPPEITSLTALTYVDLMQNHLTGIVPDDIGRLYGLETLDLSGNRLDGGIPESVGNLTSLNWLDVKGNVLGGPIPTLSRLVDLEVLDLSSNHLEGLIPYGLSGLKSLIFMSLADNWLFGHIPSWLERLKELLILDLSDNLLGGRIPAQLGKLKHLVGLFLYRNRLTGSIPSTFTDLKELSFLALHENGLFNRVPPITLRNCTDHHEDCSSMTLLTLYGNHFSCNLPERITEHGGPLTKGAVVHGNTFSLPAPDWLPKWRPSEITDKVHFHKQDRVMKATIIVAVGVLCWGAAVAVVTWVYLRHEDLSLREGRTWFYDEVVCGSHDALPEVQAHQQLLEWLGRMCLLAFFGILPACYLGSYYTECGDNVAHMSITYLSRAPKSEAVVVLLLIIYLYWVYEYVTSLPALKLHRPVVQTTTSWMGWLLVLCWASVLPMLYAAVQALPLHNKLRRGIGDTAYIAIYYGTPLASAVVNTQILPFLATHYSARTGIALKRLITVTHMVSYWLAPAAMTLYLGEGCGKRWRHYWLVCGSNQLDASVDIGDKSIMVMRDVSSCTVPTFNRLLAQHNGACCRQVLEALTPLVLQSLAIEAVAFPILNLVLWALSHPNRSGSELVLCKLGMRTSITSEEYFVQLDIWAVTSVLWGALVPLIQPIVMLAVLISYVNLRLETCVFGRKHRAEEEAERKQEQDEGEEVDNTATEEGDSITAAKRERSAHLSKAALHISKGSVKLSVVVLVVFLCIFTYETAQYLER